MARLGYERYGAQGGDWGAVVSRAARAGSTPTTSSACTSTLPPAGSSRSGPGTPTSWRRFTDAEQGTAGAPRASTAGPGTATADPGHPAADAGVRPDRLAGRPAGLDRGEVQGVDRSGADVPEDAVDRDQLLTNVMLYWLTGTAGSSARLYYENLHAGFSAAAARHDPDRRGGVRRRTTPSAATASGATTSCTGRSSTAAATSPRWRRPTCSSTTCAASSAAFAEFKGRGSGGAPWSSTGDGARHVPSAPSPTGRQKPTTATQVRLEY